MTEIMGMSIRRAAELLRAREICSVELTEACLDKIDMLDGKIGAFLFIDRENALKSALESDARRAAGESRGMLDGIPCSLKDNLCTSDMPTTCASQMLSGYIPPYDASAVRMLRCGGAVILGKNNMDEFAMGADCTLGAFGPCKNPHDTTRAAGGSSGGSAAAVASDMSFFSLGSDSGGSVRLPAAHCGVVGLKPTYGAVSRYGLIAYASSLDTVGTLCKSIADTRTVLDLIKGRDELDQTSFDMEKRSERVSVKGLRIALPRMLFSDGISRDVSEAIDNCVGHLESAGAMVEEISVRHMAGALSAYYIIAMSEASSNLARYDGIRFGHRSSRAASSTDELMSYSRAEGFGNEVKRRIIAGTYFLSEDNYEKYYLCAHRIRECLRAEMSALYARYDAILSPVALDTAKKMTELGLDMQAYREDALTATANLTGMPAISVPYPAAKGMPIGIQLMAAHCREDILLALGEIVERGVTGDAL